MNLEQLASVAGVSLSTVSKAFSGSKEISQKTRDRIFELAKENDCFDKYYSAKRSKKVILVICPEIDSQYYSSMISKMEKEITKRGAIFMLSLNNFSAKKESELISFYQETKDVDGIIVIAAQTKIKFNKDVPIVAVNTKRDNSEVDCINTAYSQSLSDTVDYLIKNGHEKIALICDEKSKSRVNIFSSHMQKKGLIVNPEFSFCEKTRFEEAGYMAMEKIYALKDKPTAIFCSYDYIALGVIQNIRTHGDNVPDDFSVIGVDDIPIASHYNVALTTVHSNLDSLSELAVDLMFKKIENKFYLLHQKISLRSELVIRNTVKNIKKDEN